jgi:hypothetical protein
MIRPSVPQYQQAVINATRCRPQGGLGDDCLPIQIGGIQKILFTARSRVTSVYNEVTGEVRQIVAFGAIWYEIQCIQAVSTLTANEVSGRQGRYYEHTLNVSLHGLGHGIRNPLFNFNEQDLILIAQDKNGQNWLVGWPMAARVREVKFQTGAQYADFRGASFVFSANNIRRFPLVLNTVVENLIKSDDQICNETYQTNIPIQGPCVIDGNQII